MPYISPAISPSKSFSQLSHYPTSSSSANATSPSSPTARSPALSRSGSGRTTPTSSSASSSVSLHASYKDAVPSSSSAASTPAPGASGSTVRRHHSRSHSSESLASASDRYAYAKATPGYAYSPYTDGDEPSSSSYARVGSWSHSSSGGALRRPAMRSSRTLSSTGDSGDVAPPRSASSKRGKKMMYLADSSPRTSISGLPPTDNEAIPFPLPDLDAMSPPALGNHSRSASSPALLNAHEERSRQLGHSHLSETDAIQEEDDDSFTRASDLSANDSALTTSSESASGSGSASNSDNDDGRHSPNTSRRKQTHWGDIPTPTMGGATSFSFGSGSASNSREASPTHATHDSSYPPSGPLAPGATKAARRPAHVKSFSERSDASTPTGQPALHIDVRGTTSELLPDGRDKSRRQRPPPLPTPMLRKKSGELVKSSLKHEGSSSRAKSLPATPTGPKAVHFDEQLERVKLFLAQQKPTAVSRDGSPIETETEDDSEAAFPFPPMTTAIPAQISLVLPEFPKNALPDLGSRDVCLETLEIAADWKSLKGTALLRNLAFEKRLSIRFTFDDWQTVSEVTGEYASTLVGGTVDRWAFSIKLHDILARIEDRVMYLALRYSVNGQDIWDSNHGRNYRAEFRRQAARSQAVVGGARAARHEWAVTNPGQASERMADLRRELDRLVADHGDSADELVLASNGRGGARYAPRFVGGEAVPLAQAPATNTFSSRYDFGAAIKNEKAKNSPQISHAILDNPYFASPQAQIAAQQAHAQMQAQEAVGAIPWRNPANILSPPSSGGMSLQSSPPKPHYANLYADGSGLTSTIIGGMPATTFSEPPSSSAASFSGNTYYARNESNGVISTDYGLPNAMQLSLAGLKIPLSPPQDVVPMSPTTPTPTAEVPDPPHVHASSAPAGELLGGVPLARQSKASASFPPLTSPIPASLRAAGQLEPSLQDADPLDTSLYSPALSTEDDSRTSTETASPPGDIDDLLSPSPSSASTDTSISTPQSPNGSPPLKPTHFLSGGTRPDVGSESYFTFLHRYCWGNGDGSGTPPVAPSPTASTHPTSQATALGLAGLDRYALDTATPRRTTPPASVYFSANSSGSRTPSPRHGSPSLEATAQMEKAGYLRAVHSSA